MEEQQKGHVSSEPFYSWLHVWQGFALQVEVSDKKLARVTYSLVLSLRQV